jgi:hypothetical protein
MGSYAQCWLGDFYVGSSKNDVDPGLLSLFRESDKRIVSLPNAADAVFPYNDPHWLGEFNKEHDSDDDLVVVYYSAPVPVVRDRLNLLGYTLSTAREAFDEYIKGERRLQTESFKRFQDRESEESRARLQDHYDKTLSLLSELNADAWLTGLEEIRRLGLKPNYFGQYKWPHEDTLVGYMLSNEWYGFPGPDLNVALRLALEVCPDAKELVYDITDLVLGEYFEPEQDLVQYGLGLLEADYHSQAKIIILTEGRSDTWILKESLNLLFPHLAGYYSFMEFDLTRVGGGAGNLANLIKAFAGAGIVNRSIALFDNDTAGTAAMKGLEKIPLPSHIKVLRLPDIDFLKNYPTIGPSGEMTMDVNGVAGSIELYLGKDALTGDGGKFIPVQWTGFDSGMRQYQGEVLEKDRIHERFRRKLESAKSDPATLSSEHWNTLKAVLSTVFSAFNDLANEQICGWARAYSEH